MDIRGVLVKRPTRMLLQALLSQSQIRSFVFAQIEKALYKETQENELGHCSYQAQQDRLDCASALLHGMDRIMKRRLISRNVLSSMLDVFLGNVILNQDSAKARQRLGFNPPSFVTISPTGKCNLRCKGCYASDDALQGEQLDFSTFDRILREKRELWGSHFTVISGGEPFLWRDSGYDLLKMAARHPQDAFMVYTNGTLIDDAMAARIAEIGNVTPVISVEGFKEETDFRRGEGVYDKILAALENLRKHGVPFGISSTATRLNWEVVTSDEFVDFFFMEQGALYNWIFQYMPIGRSQTLDLVVQPEARVRMFERMWRLVRERKVFMVDFWNSGTASLGCISAGRGSGYFYINWDGDIMPCVFTPYAADNIRDIYARGEDLNSVLQLPLFKKIRDWQHNYGYEKSADETDNWICCCSIRDHFDEFAEMVKQCGARPINEEARQAIEDQDYYQGMVDYGKQMRELTDATWEKHYTKPLAENPLDHNDEWTETPVDANRV